MKPQYEKAAKKIRKFADGWEYLFGLQGFMKVEHRFIEAFKEDDDPATIADTQCYWQYRLAVMRWFLPAVVRLSDSELDGDVCHEYVHVLTNPMESHVGNEFEEQCEFAVQSVTLALLNTRKVLADLVD